MPTFLITICETSPDNVGIRLSPGIRPAEVEDRPAIKKMRQGSILELRFPDGTTRTTRLVTYGVSVWKTEDGSLTLHDNPRNPEIFLTLPPDVSSEVIPSGTEVWLMENESD